MKNAKQRAQKVKAGTNEVACVSRTGLRLDGGARPPTYGLGPVLVHVPQPDAVLEQQLCDVAVALDRGA